MRAWILGRGGLLGGAVEKACLSDVTMHRPGGPPPWEDPLLLRAEFEAECATFFDAAAGGPWQILWCAGRGTLASRESEMSQDSRAFLSLLEAVESTCPPDLVKAGLVFFASSVGGLYAGSSSPPFTEQTVPVPTSDYGRAKLAQEDALRGWAARTGARALIGRISNLYGARQDLSKNQGLISTICASILRREPINLFVPLETSRNYIYVADAARVIVEASRLLAACPPGRTTVKLVAADENVTIASLLSTARAVSGVRPLVTFGGGRSRTPQARNINLRSVVLPEADAHPKLSVLIGLKRVMMDMQSHYCRYGWDVTPYWRS